MHSELKVEAHVRAKIRGTQGKAINPVEHGLNFDISPNGAALSLDGRHRIIWTARIERLYYQGGIFSDDGRSLVFSEEEIFRDFLLDGKNGSGYKGDLSRSTRELEKHIAPGTYTIRDRKGNLRQVRYKFKKFAEEGCKAKSMKKKVS